MNADRRDTLTAISIAVAFNIRAKRSHSTVCWAIRDLILRLGRYGIPAFLLALAATVVGFFFHVVNPLRKAP
jgi:hypothetical protein